MELKEQAAKLLQRFLTSNNPGDITFDGATITHTISVNSSEEGLDTIWEFRFSFDGEGLHAYASASPNTPDMEKRKELVGIVVDFFEQKCSTCPLKGTDSCESDPFKKLKFGDGRISYSPKAVQLNPGLGTESLFLGCVAFEDDFARTIDAIFDAMMLANSVVVVISLDELLASEGVMPNGGKEPAPKPGTGSKPN